MKRGKVALLAAAIAAMSAMTAANAVEVLNEGDIAAPYSAPVTLKGALYESASETASVAGIVELKLGKVNEKKQTSKISGSVIGLDGKKHAIKAFVATGVDGALPKQVALEVKGLGTMSVTIGGGRFAGSLGAFHVQLAAVGGNWTKTDSVVQVEVPDADLAKFAGAVVKDLLPDDEPVILSGGKWKFNKAAGVKWAKIKPGVEPFGGLKDEASGKGLLVDTSKGSNLSGMKLVYTPKNGTFKGSFKVYALEGSGAKTKLKKYTINVSGVVVDGIGYGKATCKKPSIVWAVSVGAKGDGQGQTAHEGVQLWDGGPYWAEKNVGARYPWHTGYYFWWGDTEGYRPASDGTFDFDFSETNPAIYTYGKSVSDLQSSGWLTGDGVLAPEHDAAHVQWRGDWRMPTKQEMDDLVDKCAWSLAMTNGIAGFIVRGMGDYASNSIFLPAVGCGYGTSLYNHGLGGLYWSSVPDSFGYGSGGLGFDWGDRNTSDCVRVGGFSVRPVQSPAE